MLMKKVHNVIFFTLSDKVLRQVSKEKWSKLESLYVMKSLVNYLYVKQAFYSYMISIEKAIGKQLNEFNKLILDLKNIDI